MSDISQMDFKELRNEVQMLRDELAIMRREYEDILYNLDYENFSGKLIKEKDEMKAEIKINADEISTKVSQTELDNTLTDYSTKTQTATSITSTVSKFISSCFELDETPTYQNTTTEQKRQLCLYNDNFYSYNSISREWELYDLENGEHSYFKQTSDGFMFKGNVNIKGILIVNPKIKANKLVIIPFGDDNTTTENSGLLLKSYYNGELRDMFEISCFESLAPQIYFDSKPNASGYWTFPLYFTSNVDFSEATIHWGNNKPTAVFG